MSANFSFGMGVSNLNNYIRQQSLQKKVNSGQTDKEEALAKAKAKTKEQEFKAKDYKEKSQSTDNVDKSDDASTEQVEESKENKKSKDQIAIDAIVRYMEHYNSEESQVKQRLGIVMAKLSGGGTVSSSDMQFIKKHSPDLYSKLCKAKAAKEQLAKKLKRCKTRSQVMHLRTNVTQAAIIPNSASHSYSSGATASDMVSKTGVQSYQYHAMSSEWNQFVRSKAYQKLPIKLKKALRKVNKTI